MLLLLLLVTASSAFQHFLVFSDELDDRLPWRPRYGQLAASSCQFLVVSPEVHVGRLAHRLKLFRPGLVKRQVFLQVGVEAVVNVSRDQIVQRLMHKLCVCGTIYYPGK